MAGRYHPPWQVVILNQAGRGLIQMGKLAFPHQSYYDAIRIPPLNELLRLIKLRRRLEPMGRGQVWIRKGVSTAASLTFTGTGNDWQAVDGLDLTADFTSDEAISDYGVSIIASAVATTIYFALEVDGVVRPEFTVEANKTTSAGQFNGSSSNHVGSGMHRLRLMMTTAAVCTIDFKSQARYLRIINLAME